MEKLMMERSIINIKKELQEDEANQFDAKVHSLVQNSSLEISEYCINKFLNSEIDLQSPGLRGVGRITDEIPRFGGYYRNTLQDLYKDELLELKKTLKELMYIGYLMHFFCCEEELKATQYQDKYKLYQIWTMYLLGFDQNTFQEEIVTLQKVSKKTIENCNEQMRKLQINGLNGSDELVLERILFYYGTAAFALRRREMGFRF